MAHKACVPPRLDGVELRGTQAAGATGLDYIKSGEGGNRGDSPPCQNNAERSSDK